MGRRSFFFKDYVAHLILIVCAFALAGVVFCYQMSSYALHAKQTELRTGAWQSLAEQSSCSRVRTLTMSVDLRAVYRARGEGG